METKTNRNCFSLRPKKAPLCLGQTLFGLDNYVLRCEDKRFGSLYKHIHIGWEHLPDLYLKTPLLY